MNFKFKNNKIWLFIFMVISIFFFVSNKLIYGADVTGLEEAKVSSKNDYELEIDNLLCELEDPQKNEFKTILNDALKDSAGDASKEALNEMIKSIPRGVDKEDLKKFLNDNLLKISWKKEILENLKNNVEKCSQILSNEKTFVTVKNVKNIIVVGDLHGDYRSAGKYIKKIRELFETDSLSNAVFLGDYVDRGPNSVEVLHRVIRLKLDYPDKVILLKGNHETRKVFKEFSKYDANNLNQEIDRVFYPLNNKKINDIKEAILNFFEKLPLAAEFELAPTSDDYRPRKILAVHAGFPCEEDTDVYFNELIWYEFMDLKKTTVRCLDNYDDDLGTQILWNDFNVKNPDIYENVFNNIRGCGKLISKKSLIDFCEMYKYDFIVRGHTFFADDPFNNYMNLKKCFTIFSASNYYGLAGHGCIAHIDYRSIQRIS